MIFLTAFAILILGLWSGTYVYARYLERLYPARGRLVDIGGAAIHCVETPARGAELGVVVLVHGASGNHADPQLALADRLAARGYRVISVDRPGHGWSGRPGPRSIASAPDQQARWIRTALERMGVGEAIIAVHSLAGALGLAMALDAPKFARGVVLIAPATHPWPGGVSWYYTVATTPVVGTLFRWLVVAWAAQLNLPSGLKSVFSPNPTPPDYMARTGLKLMLRPWHFLINAEDVADFEGHVRRLQPHYARIRAPVAIVTGGHDNVVYADIHAFGCKRDIPGATLTFLEGVGHSPHFARPDAVVEAIADVDRRATTAGRQRALA